MSNHVLLPVVPSNICVDSSCQHRRGLSRRAIAWRAILSLCRIVSVILIAAIIGASISQMVLRGQSSAEQRIHDAIDKTRLEGRIDNADNQIKDLRAVIQEQQNRITSLEGTENKLEGMVLVCGAILGFIQFIKMIAGKKIKEES